MKDLIGEEVKEQLEENAAKYNPFNRDRETQYRFLDKSKGGCFKDLSETALDRFILSKKREFTLKY